MLNITAHLHYAKRFCFLRRFDTGHPQKAYRYSVNAPPENRDAAKNPVLWTGFYTVLQYYSCF